MLTQDTDCFTVAVTLQKKKSHSLATVSNLDTKAGVERLPLFFLCDVSPYLHFSGLHRTGDFYSLSVSEITDSPTCPIQPFLFLAKHRGLPINLFYLGGATMHKATTTPSPYYCATFNNPSLSMSIKLKDMSDKYQRFVDFQAGVMFPVQSDNSIKINSFQYEKIMDIISMELTKFVKDGFPTNSKPITENTFTIENNNNLIGEPTMGNTNNLPQVFTFESDKQIRTIKKDDDILFVAKDVADALEYTWAGIATIKHVPDIWRGVNSVLTPPKKVTPDFSISGIDPFEDWKVSQEMLCLTEQGLYFFINRSDKPKALPFQMWLAGEVLPSIRKTGSYSTNANDNLNNMNNAILEKMALLLEKMVEQSQPKRTRKAKEVPALKEHTLFENQEALHNQHLDLIEKAIALAADSGKPFTHKRLHGIYEKRNRLSKELQHLGRKPLESMTQQLLYSGRVVKCRLALGAGRKQWLDVPTGNFGQGNGVIHR